MPSFGDLEVLDQLDNADFLNSSTRIRRFKGSKKNAHTFPRSKGNRISQWPRMRFVRAVDIFNPTEEVNRMIQEEKSKQEATRSRELVNNNEVSEIKHSYSPKKPGTHPDVVLFKPVRYNGTSREDKEPSHIHGNIHEDVPVSKPENELKENHSSSITLNTPRSQELPKREGSQKENISETKREAQKTSEKHFGREKPYVLSDTDENLPDEDSTDTDLKFSMNKFANLSMNSENDEDDESMEGDDDIESINAESADENELSFSMDSDLLNDQNDEDYDYDDEVLANVLAETENLEDEEVNALLNSVFDDSDDSEIEAYLSVGDTGVNDFTLYDYDSDDEPYQRTTQEPSKEFTKKGNKKKEKPKKASKKETRAQRKLERKAGKSVANRLASAYDVDDDIAQELEMYSHLQEQWIKDHQKKAKKRNEREEKRAQGLLGKKSSKKLAKKAAASEKGSDPDSPTLSKADHAFIMDAYKRMQQLSLSGVDEVSLPACPKYVRRLVHELANRLNLRSQSYGSGKKRYTVLSKTPRFNSLDINSASLTRILHRVQLSVGKRSGIPGKPGKKPNIMLASKRTVSSATKLYEGQVVGGDAPEITRANPGRRMLERLGWYAGKGLGHPENEGSHESLRAIVKTSRSGLG
ncbi:R3H and G-patch domain-containing protein [Schizosaccharomyces octosporus yFS286]|uniref:R3H and G-patch domain-containing protein n=1 Tax=Schizosaccharomyces octosporus (strain yFS286) TaxID=483514 RepID=S9Q265_SCHOY|nr:R3H and G-patch domain-containing protein [Schizosaccharomyces octosporus yFS286]EPX74177.1 R3H and G-patch domain-containing protein [Schizosaccharomyces octosporus yFS286]